MLLSEAWYQSGLFWAIAAAAIAVIAMPVGVVAAYRSANPKRRLIFGMFNVAPLVGAPAGVRGDLEIRHQGEVVADPQLVTLAIASRSRRDISSDDFDQARPIVLDLGVPITKLIDQSSTAGKVRDVPAPVAVVGSTELRIGPGLIRRDHAMTWTLLVDGTPQLKSQIFLRDVDSHRRNDYETEDLLATPVPRILIRLPRWIHLTWILPVGLAVAVVLTAIISGSPPPDLGCI
jgi:hypothetical protein